MPKYCYKTTKAAGNPYINAQPKLKMYENKTLNTLTKDIYYKNSNVKETTKPLSFIYFCTLKPCNSLQTQHFINNPK